MTFARSATALLVKESLHHGAAFFGLSIWSALMVPLALSIVLSQGGTSIMSGATGLTYYYMPCVIFLVVGRLVVTEREDGTVQFMNALPATLSLRLAAKIAVGLPFVWVINTAMVLPLMTLSALREFVTLGWFVQVLGMQLFYSTCWFSLCLFVAHAGRFRHWIWMSLLAVAMTEALPEDWQSWTWHASLAQSIELTRHQFPWSDVVTSFAWLAVTTAGAFLLATFRGGSLTDGVFRGISNRERTTGTALVLALYLTLEVVPEMGHGSLYGWDSLPSHHPDVHHVGEVDDWPLAAKEILDVIHDWAPSEPTSRVILAQGYAPARTNLEPHLQADDRWDRDELLVRVNGPVTTGDKARLVQAILDQRSAKMLALNPRVGFAYDGLGLYLVEPSDRRQLAQMRSAVAVTKGLRAEDLTDWSALRNTYGKDVAAGVGAIGLVALESCGNSDAVPTVARDLLLPVIPENTWGVLQAAEFHSEDYGCSTEAWRRDWWQRLQKAHDTRIQGLQAVTGWVGTLDSTGPDEQRRSVSWQLERIDPDRVTLVLNRTDPLRGHPIPYSESTFTRELQAISGRTDTPFAPSDGLEGYLRVWAPEIQGHVISGWMKSDS